MNLITFEQQVNRYQQRVFSYAVHYLRDHAEAEDVTQEVLLRLWRHREDVDPERVLGWLLRVTPLPWPKPSPCSTEINR